MLKRIEKLIPHFRHAVAFHLEFKSTAETDNRTTVAPHRVCLEPVISGEGHKNGY